jgi:hypothetical protein
MAKIKSMDSLKMRKGKLRETEKVISEIMVTKHGVLKPKMVINY